MIKSRKKGLKGVRSVAVAAHFSKLCKCFKEFVKLPLHVSFKTLNIFRAGFGSKA